MTLPKITDLQQALIDAEAVALDLRKKIEEFQRKDRIEAIEQVRKLIKTYNLVGNELGLKRKKQTKPAAISNDEPIMTDKRAKVAAKYRDTSGKTWSGRGKTPSWVTSHLSAGGTLEELAITN